MLKRILLILAMGATLVACSPSGTATSPGAESAAPTESSMPSEAPSESPSESPASS
jgi:photosystem II stability/assembly factor-like uncharacterized protein